MPPSAIAVANFGGEFISERRRPLRGNPEGAAWIVQKFGGTSLGKFAESIAQNIIRPRIKTHRTAVVCSALSTGTKAEGTTSRLLRAAAAALNHCPPVPHTQIVVGILADHIAAARAVLKSASLLQAFTHAAEAECERLLSFLSAAQVLDEISPKTRDIIIGTGERLSCLYVTALLQDRGVDAEYVDLENIVHPAGTSSGGSGSGALLTQDFYTDVGRAIAERVRGCGHRVPVVTGFFGAVPGSLLAGIGRGYTDLCAALLAVGIGAAECQVWKEVDGIFTADPRKVPQARLIPLITPEETAELTYWGAEVIHPFTMEQVIRARIPIRVKNVTNPLGSGTVIFPHSSTSSSSSSSSPSSSSSLSPQEASLSPSWWAGLAGDDVVLKPRGKRPTAVTTKNDMTVLSIRSNRKKMSHGFLAGIFATLDARRLAVDLISTSEVHVSMAVHTDTPARLAALIAAGRELESFGSVEVIRGLTILAVVGCHMKNMVGIAGRMFQTMADSGVNIEMISQGSNEINISCVIREQDALKAMTIIHTKLFLYSEDEGEA